MISIIIAIFLSSTFTALMMGVFINNKTDEYRHQAKKFKRDRDDLLEFIEINNVYLDDIINDFERDDIYLALSDLKLINYDFQELIKEYENKGQYEEIY